MDEFENGSPQGIPAEIFLGTAGASDSSGMEITLDGETEPMTKHYRQLLTGRTVPEGARIAVLKISGSYVVLGEIGDL